MAVMIRSGGLAKSFGRTRALAGVDLEVEGGSVLGLLGPNGAGKTTAVRMRAADLLDRFELADAGGRMVKSYSGDAAAPARDRRAGPGGPSGRCGRPRAGRRAAGGLTGSPATVDRDVRRIGVPMADPAWLPVAVRRLDEAGIAVIDLGLRRPSLDEVFLALTDHSTAAPPSEPRQAPGRTAA